MSRSLLFRFILILAAASLLLAACGQPAATPQPTNAASSATQVPQATTTPAPVQGGTLTIGLSQEPNTLDPGAAVYVQEQFVLISLFDSLLSIAPDASVHPGLALSWQPNSDYTQFTFKLRPDVKFHDGTPFNGAAVKASFDHIMSGDVLDSGGKTELTDHKYLGVDVADDYDITVKFGSPYPTFLNDAGRQWLSISSPTALAKYGKDYGRHPVGTGPYEFVKWDAQSEIVLQRNPDYNWGPEFAAHTGPGYLDQIVYRFLPEAATRLTAFQSNELQVVQDPPTLDAVSMSDSGQGIIKTFPNPGIPGIMMLNTTKAPTDDLAVRKAMILAVNQDELVKTVYKTLGMPSTSVLSPTTWSYDQNAASLYHFNLDQANQLLDQDGWKLNSNGIREKDGKTLTIDYITSPSWEEQFNELLAGYLQKAGFDVKLRSMDDAGIASEAANGNYNMLYMYWSRADPSPLRILFDSANINGGSAYTHYVDPQLDKVLEDGDVQTNLDTRKQDYVTAQQIIMQNALVLPLFTINNVYMVTPAVQNFTFDLEGYPYLYDVWLTK